MLAILTGLVMTPLAGAESVPESLAPLVRLLTGQVAISNAIVEIRYNHGEAARRFQFRYQANGFYAREFCPAVHEGTVVCLNDMAAGRWDDTYWHFDPRPDRFPLLYLAPRSGEDTNSLAYNNQRAQFASMFTLFHTLGITADPNASLFWHGNALWFRDGRSGVERPVTLHLTNGVPAALELDLPVDGRQFRRIFDYGFDPTVAPAGVPTHSLRRDGLIEIIVESLTLLEDGARLERSWFDTPDLLYNPPVRQAVRSNRLDYFILEDGRMSVMDRRLPERELAREAFSTRSYAIGLLAIIAALLPVWLIVRGRMDKQLRAK